MEKFDTHTLKRAGCRIYVQGDAGFLVLQDSDGIAVPLASIDVNGTFRFVVSLTDYIMKTYLDAVEPEMPTEEIAEELQVEHINGDRGDNRIVNLRVV